MKKTLLLFLIISMSLIVAGCNTKKDSKDIIKYEMKTTEYFNGLKDSNKYYINSKDELYDFYSMFSDKLNIDEKYLGNNTIFIEVKQVGSGSIDMKLENVTFDNNNVNFVLGINSPQIGTDDMACWYLVAIIPNKMLEKINLEGWVKPSDIKIK